MMARFRIVDCTLLVVVIFFIYTISFGGSPKDEIFDEYGGQIAPNYLYEDIREMCQFLEHEIRGDEGDQWLKGNDYENELKLRGIHVAFRHGERSPLTATGDDNTDCIPQRDIDRKNFQKYKELALSEDVVEFLRVDKSIETYPRVPDDSKCSSGLLTAEGALQHVKLGKFLRERYSKTKLFEDDSQRIVTDVITSKYPRTLQSLLAFSSEFLFKKRNFLTPVEIRASDHTFQCVDDFCDCKLARKMRKDYEKEHAEYFANMLELSKNKHLSEEVAKIRHNFADFSESDDPLKIIDVSLGKFICRRKKLPCNGEDCLDYGFLNEMINISTIRGEEMFENRKSGISRKLHVLEAWPVLSYVRDSIAKIRKFPHTNYIRIFSGHDVLIAPILRVLGIPFVDPPHYTSRIIFEIYEHLNDGIFIRVMYNGYNRSSDVKFCKNSDLKFGMCRASAFENFMKPENYFQQIGVTNFRDACT
ncbi:unnamed protein product [Caenorhabditis angaria]|uniref:Uncharacterized protein n=1 Tax=Caenorhabditis angaria TaxID=860376 RepID=A0A9P1IHC5_9PELO|nr:unnamed protein product [Caenorhabditis angaria]